MAENNPQPLETDSESLREEYYDNSSQRLKRHIYINSKGEYDHDIADFIFKKAGYTCTYIVVHTTGIPDGVILNLCDENSNQLYSPVDTNKNWTTTACSVTIGETDIIPLPAQFNSQLSSHVPFSAGTYNWKLKFSGNSYYEEKELPLEIEIRDFKVWDILTPEVYPNEDIKVKLKTYADTYYPNNHFDNNLLTTNATYDASTGIITYPNSDIDSTVGKHMQVINQSINCFIDYEIKNPYKVVNGTYLTTSWTDTFNYSQVSANQNFPGLSIGATTIPPQWYMTYDKIVVKINNQILSSSGAAGGDINQTKYYSRSLFPPGTYNCEVTVEHNNTDFIVNDTFQVTTENCSVSLEVNESNNIVATYLYDNTTSIPNANIDIVEIDTNSIVYSGVTDANGQIQIPYANGIYKAIVKDSKTNENLLYSEVLSLNTPYLNNVSMSNDGELLLTYGNGNGIDNISINNDGDLILTLDNEITNIITDVSIAENGELYYKRK